MIDNTRFITKDLDFFGELINQIDALTFNYNKIINNTRVTAGQKTPQKIAELNLIEQMVLRYIYLYGPFNMSTLSSLTNLKPSYLSRVTESLQKTGFCEKNQSRNDQRVYNIKLTDAGFSMTKEHVESLRGDFLQRFYAILSKDEISEFKKNLLLIIEDLSLVIKQLTSFKDTYPVDIYSCDLFELMDKRSKCANRLILEIGANKKLPFFEENFNYYQNNIVFHLYISGAMSISSLSKLTGFKLKHLSGTLKGLIGRGFLLKNQNPKDKRVHFVELSSIGKKMAKDQNDLEKQSYSEYFSAVFSSKQLDCFFNAHKTINHFFERF